MKLALIGDPVEDSASPVLHRRFLDESDIDGYYDAIRVPRGAAGGAMRRLRREGYTGCNVTYPLKEEALSECDEVTPEARRAQAINTVFFGQRIIASNTDGIGARMALEAIVDEPIALKRVGVLGYGATARAILTEFHDNDVYSFVWGRDAARVKRVCAATEADPWPDANIPEIVVSTLPPDAQLPAELVAQLQRPIVLMDVNYGSRATLERQVRREVVDGTGMLESQARASFDFWLVHYAS